MLTIVSDPADFSDSVSICPRTVSVAHGFKSIFEKIRLINLKGDIEYFSKGPKLSRTGHTQKRRSFRVNLILSFRHNDKHETQHVGQPISIKGHII